ncbi:hypothetical protein T484DRAFT_1821414, partial [Baffinella frigidus]
VEGVVQERLAKKACPNRVKGVVQERLAKKACPNRAVLHTLQQMLQNPSEGTEDKPTANAEAYARESIEFENAPLHVKERIKADKARHFAQQAGQQGMENKPATDKQCSFLRGLGCAKAPTSMAEASALIERYKKF